MKSTNAPLRPSLWLAMAAGAALTASCAAPMSPTRQQACEASPQWHDGKFRNRLPQVDASMFTLLGKALGNDAQTKPSGPLPVVQVDASRFETPPSSGLRVTWLGHSTVLVEIDGQRVLTDPVWSDRVSPFSWVGPERFFDPPLPLSQLPSVDAVVISHSHFDHLDEETISALAAADGRVGRFVVPLAVGKHLEEFGVRPDQIVELDWWQATSIGGLTLTATPARHFSGRQLTDLTANDTLWAGWSIAGRQHRVFYSGDTSMFPEFRDIGERLGPFDVTLMETGAYDSLWADVHLGPEQAYLAHQMVRGKLMIPVHWGTFDLANHGWTEPVERLAKVASQGARHIAVPRPGESIEPATPPTLTRWWPEIPWNSATEDPVVSSHLPSDLRVGPQKTALDAHPLRRTASYSAAGQPWASRTR